MYNKRQVLAVLSYEASDVTGLHKSKIKRAGVGLVSRGEGGSNVLTSKHISKYLDNPNVETIILALVFFFILAWDLGLNKINNQHYR